MANQRILTEKDVDYLEKRLSKVFVTKDEFKKYRSEFLEAFDQVLGELVKIRENQEILTPVTYDVRERVEKLEKIHPSGQHATS